MSRVRRASELTAAELAAPPEVQRTRGSAAKSEGAPLSASRPALYLRSSASIDAVAERLLTESRESAIVIAAAHRVCSGPVSAVAAPEAPTRKRRRHLSSTIYSSMAPSISSAPAIWAPRPLLRVPPSAWSRIVSGTSQPSPSVLALSDVVAVPDTPSGAGGTSEDSAAGGAAATFSLPATVSASSWLVPVFVDVRLSSGDYRLVDVVLWDVYETGITPLQWAAERCRAGRLPEGLAAAAANAVAAQLAEFAAAVAPDVELAVENVAARLRRLARSSVGAAAAAGGRAAADDAGGDGECAPTLNVPDLGGLLARWGEAGAGEGGGAALTPAALFAPATRLPARDTPPPAGASLPPVAVFYAPPLRATLWAPLAPPAELLRCWLRAPRLPVGRLHPAALLSLGWLRGALAAAAAPAPPAPCVLGMAVDVSFARQRLRGTVAVDLWRDCCSGGGGGAGPDGGSGGAYWLAAVIARAVATIRTQRAPGGGSSKRGATAAPPPSPPSAGLLFLLAAAVQRRVNDVLAAVATADMGTLEAIEAAAAQGDASAAGSGGAGSLVGSLSLTAAPPLPGTEAAPEAAADPAARAPLAPQPLLQPEHAAAAVSALPLSAPPLPVAIPPVITSAASARLLPLRLPGTVSVSTGVPALLAVVPELTE